MHSSSSLPLPLLPSVMLLQVSFFVLRLKPAIERYGSSPKVAASAVKENVVGRSTVGSIATGREKSACHAVTVVEDGDGDVGLETVFSPPPPPPPPARAMV